MKCDKCGHPDWCHHTVSGKCNCMYFDNVIKTKLGYDYDTIACECITKQFID